MDNETVNGHIPMFDTFPKVEVTPAMPFRRRFSTDQKLAVVAETMQPSGVGRAGRVVGCATNGQAGAGNDVT
jgi:hypothetical protein